ncbi:hypothetical protein, conserved [Leishmania lindenbergi]|uniref:Uncharacterized protein n=1 Tax=Leishmania lindenbergi TaxID=651832 RepID=A0AAW3AN03_9TRYP
MVGFSRGDAQRGLEPIRPRQHRLLPLPHHPAASNGVCAGTDRSQLLPSRCSARPPIAAGAPLTHRRESDVSVVRPVGWGNAVACVGAELRHTGMKPLLPCRPPAPLTSSSSAETRSSESVPGTANAAATVATLNFGAALNEQPPVTTERIPTLSPQLSLPYPHSGTTPGVAASCQPHPPSSPTSSSPACKPRCCAPAASLAAISASSSPSPIEDGVLGRYRATATQFIKGIERLNRMTTTMCNADATLIFALTEERTASGKAGARKMARVPLLPLTLCTDGSTVLLVDPNGTERHGNYLQAVDGFHQYLSPFTSTASSRNAAAPSVSSHPPSNVLWWTLTDLQREPSAVPFTTARAALSVEHLIDSQDDVNRKQRFPQPSLMHAAGDETSSTKCPAKVAAMLAAIQPSRLTLRYGEPLVLVFASPGAQVGDEAQRHRIMDGRVGAEVAADVPPWFTASEATSPQEDLKRNDFPHLGYNLLRDIYHGYLPSFLELIYPNGGVQLRGCWCDVPASAVDASTAQSMNLFSQQQLSLHPTVSPMGVSGGAAQRSSPGPLKPRCTQQLLVTMAPMPLLGWSPQSTGAAPHGHRGAAAAADDIETIMQSLRPTSLRPPWRSQAAFTATSRGANTRKLTTAAPAAVLQLPTAVLRFLAHHDDKVCAVSAKTSSGPRLCLSPSPPLPSEHTATGAAPSPRLTQRRVERHGKPDVCVTDFGPDGPILAINGFDSSRVHSDGDPRGIRDSNLRGPQLQRQWQARSGFDLVYVGALLHAPSQPPPMGMAVKTSVMCKSVVVLTPAGRVELVVPATSHAAAGLITIADVQQSLLCSPVGRLLLLRDEEVVFTYAPGTPHLLETAVVDTAHAVLRLRRRALCPHLEFAKQQMQGERREGAVDEKVGRH